MSAFVLFIFFFDDDDDGDNDDNDDIIFARFSGGSPSLVDIRCNAAAVLVVNGVGFFLELLNDSDSLLSLRCRFVLDALCSGEVTFCTGVFLRLRPSNFCGFANASKWCPAVW